MLKNYFKQLYKRTMDQAYGFASREIISSLEHGGECLDCGANEGYWCKKLSEEINLPSSNYHGIEWNSECVKTANEHGVYVVHGDLNRRLPFENGKFSCVFGLSVLEHLLNPCKFLQETHRVLAPGGKLVILTPNISTYFTAALILAGKMPSSGPHPDSSTLLKSEEIFKVSSEALQWDAETDTPVHRHLVVFSFRVLRRYLESLGYREVRGYGFGLYPFPRFSQPFLEKIDPFHCHQMVFVSIK
jgi:SAM-dependent methyltransferase